MFRHISPQPSPLSRVRGTDSGNSVVGAPREGGPRLPGPVISPGAGVGVVWIAAALAGVLGSAGCAPLPALPAIDPATLEDREPDDSADSATAVSVAAGLARVQGKLTGTDIDWFTFFGPNRGNLTITVNNVGTAGTIAEVTLEDSLHVRREQLPEIAPGESKTSRRLTLSRGQRYWLKISGEGSDDCVYRIDFRFRDQ